MAEGHATTIRLPEVLYQRLRRASFITEQAQNTIVVRALTEHLDDVERTIDAAFPGIAEKRDDGEGPWGFGEG